MTSNQPAQGETTFRRLRDLPGVLDFEARLERIATHRSPKWAPEADYLAQDADRLSRTLFGLSLDDTFFIEEIADEDALDAAWEAWEAHFAVLGEQSEFFFERQLPPDSLLQWAQLGWDVSDRNGRELWATALLGRQIIAIAKGLRPAGYAPTMSADEEADLERKLQEEAFKFRPKR